MPGRSQRSSITPNQNDPKKGPINQSVKEKYGLILSMKEFKQPILNVIEQIFTKQKVKEDEEKKQRHQSLQHEAVQPQSKYASVAKSIVTRCRSSLENTGLNDRNKKSKDKHEFSTKVHKMFARKKYSYTKGTDDQNIDRLNAKLDKYISRYLGPQKFKELQTYT